TKVFEERYALRAGIESTNSGLKNRLRLGKLRVRGRGSVFRVIWHKITGWNLLRAAASAKVRAVIAKAMAIQAKLRGSRQAGNASNHGYDLLSTLQASLRRLSDNKTRPALFKAA